MSAARHFAKSKPIIVVKSGRTARSALAAASHTGAIAADDTLYSAVFRRAGVVRVDEIEDLFNASETLSRVSSPRGPRLGIVTNAGGPGVMACDRLLHLGGELAELAPETDEKLKACLPAFGARGNPVDVAGDADAQRYAAAAQALMDDPNCDGVLAILTPLAMSDPTPTAQALVEVSRTHQLKPLLTSFMGEIKMADGIRIFRSAHVPTFDTPEDAVRAYMNMYQYTRNLANLYETPADILPDFDPDREAVKNTFIEVARDGRAILSEPEAKAVLDAYQIPAVRTVVATTAEECAAAAEQIGFPVAIKSLSHDITHKSDAAGVALVGDVVAEDLDGHREADLLGCRRAFLGGRGDHGLDDRDLVGVEHGLGLGLAEDGAAVAGDLDERVLNGLAVGIEVGEDVGRRLIEVREVARVLVHVHVGAHRVLGGVEGGHVGAVEDPDAVGHLDLAHERGEQRLRVELVSARDLDQRLGRGRGVAHRQRREDRQHAVAVGVVHERLRGGGVPLGVGVAGHVDRVAAGAEGGQAGFELLVGLGRELGELTAQVQQEVAGHHAGAAGVGHDAEAWPARARDAAQCFARVEQVFDLVDAHDASAAEDGAVQRVVGGDGAGVAGGRKRAARRAAALDDDDRLALGEVPRGAHEFARVSDRLDVEDDAARVRVGAEVVDEVAEVHVGHGADAHEGAETHLVGGRPVENGGAEGAGLAEERDASGGRDHVGEGHVEVHAGADVTQAVGADHAHAVALGDSVDVFLELLAGAADLLEAGGHDDGAGHARLAALAHRLGDGLGRHGDDRQVDLVGDLADGGVRLDALHRLRRHVDRVDDAVVLRADEVAQEDVADRPLLVGGADDGDAPGAEQFVEVTYAHDSLPSFVVALLRASEQSNHERRKRVMSIRNLDKLFGPRSIAVIGASNKKGSVGYVLLRNLISAEYDGIVYPVNVSAQSVQGIQAYASISQVPHKIDLAVIAVPAKAVPETMRECGEAGVAGTAMTAR